MPLTAHPHPPRRPRAHPHRIFLRPRPHPRPHPTLVADSLTFTSTPALAPGTLTLTSLHCARRCRLLGARVGALSSRCDAAASGAQRAGLLRARRGYLVAWLVSASAARLLWSTSGPKVPAGASAGGSRLTPGGGQAIPRARPLLGVRWAAPAAIARRASLPRRGPRAASSAVATPRVAPGPAHAGSQVAPAYGDAFRAANAGMGPRIRLGTDRPGALGRSSPAAPPRPRSTLSAPPPLPPASYTHPSHPIHPVHRSRSPYPPRAAHTHRLRGSRPPHPSSPVYAQALRVAL